MRPLRRGARLLSVLTLLALLGGTTLAVTSTAAYAAPTPDPTVPPTPTVTSLDQVVNNIRAWLFGLLLAVATLFLTVGGLRLMWANGDPGEAEKGKAALRSAAIGYGLALLAPLIVTIVGSWVS
jgi:Type IV secretion system pilin